MNQEESVGAIAYSPKTKGIIIRGDKREYLEDGEFIQKTCAVNSGKYPTEQDAIADILSLAQILKVSILRPGSIG